MTIVIAYDVSAKQADVKAQMTELGYEDKRLIGGGLANLPNTTLCSSCTASRAIEDIRAITKKLGVTLERAVAVEVQAWVAIPGEPHS